MPVPLSMPWSRRRWLAYVLWPAWAHSLEMPLRIDATEAGGELRGRWKR